MAATAEDARFQLVPSSSDAGHDLDASCLGIAEETPLAGIVPVQRPHASPRLLFGLAKEKSSFSVTAGASW